MSTKKAGKKVDKDLCRIITPEGRVSYPHVFKAQAPGKNDTPKFSITLLFPKNTDLMGTSPSGEPRSLKQVVKNAKLAAFGPKENWPGVLKSPFVDGDDPKFADKEGYQGHWVIKATTGEDNRPSVVNSDMSPIVDPAVLYPGCYARAYIFARVFDHPTGGQGVHFVLDHVQKMRDGKSFAGKKPVEQVFQPVADLDDDGDSDDSDEDDVEDF